MLPERPPVAALARHLALAERTVRQAIAELVAEGCLTFRFTGAGRPARADEEVWDPEERPDIAREHAFIRAATALPSRAEHLAMMARLRDRAVAARRIATAVSAERALGQALGIGAKPRCGTNAQLPAVAEPEVQLAPPHEELAAVNAINIDRALSPTARHAAIELLLDPVDDPADRPDDIDFYWSVRLAGRLRITVRAARKALAELADVNLIAQARIKTHGEGRVMPGSEICIYPGRIAERMRRGTDAPPLLALEPADPVEAHVRRLEALRDLACDAGLAPTAITAQHAIGRALDFAEERAAEAEDAEEPAAEAVSAPAPAPVPPRIDVLGFVRHLLDTDPTMGPVIADVMAEIRNLPQPEPAIAEAAE
ncbi:hypothetical protein [Desertibaculum subflavum]|uniref:hypothetical protein n=1 Tax=Desertibaculum subflavum TaxID=2268458 RepID=UPI000E666164